MSTAASQRYPRGSEWRKWDLHAHAPSAALNNQFEGKTLDEKWEKYVAALEAVSDIAVLGITDYFSIDGFLRLRQFQRSGRLQSYELLLPNVELRLLPVTDSTHPINIHVIFSPNVADQLESDFFQSLEFPYAGNPYKCTRTDLIRLGRAFTGKQDLPDETAYREGVTQFKVTLNDLTTILDRSKDLRTNCVVAVANSSQDGNSGIQHSSLAATRQEIYRLSHLIFSGNPNDIQYFLGRGVDSPARVISQYGSVKPCITGCDAHSLSQLFQPALGRHTWIKADPTFYGLGQILNEPEERVFIGDIPPSLARLSLRATRIARAVEIRRLDTATTSEKWFDSAVPLNSELIAVIGNKGSGKSALSDILGLLGNTPRHGSFSFLRADRFRNTKNNKAKQFAASLLWADNTRDSVPSLDSSPGTEAFSHRFTACAGMRKVWNNFPRVSEETCCLFSISSLTKTTFRW